MLIRILLTEQNENESELIRLMSIKEKKSPYKRMPINKQKKCDGILKTPYSSNLGMV